MIQLIIIFFAILLTVVIARLLSFAVLKWHILPLDVLSNGKRSHHFVWGNILIVFASFLVIGLGVSPANYLIPILYGVGLGLVLDEFPHWTGNVKELTRNIAIIPGALPVVAVAEGLIVILIVLKYLGVI